jgi:hypothetical protein
MFGMDGTFTSMLAFAGTPLERAVGISKSAERVEAVLQSQFKAVKRLFQQHSEALMAVAEALIERDELVAEDIKQLIDEADARHVNKIVLSEFAELLDNGNGHSNGNGKNGNGHVLAGSYSNGSSNLIEAPKVDSSSLPDDAGMAGYMPDMQFPLDDDMLFYLEG